MTAEEIVSALTPFLAAHGYSDAEQTAWRFFIAYEHQYVINPQFDTSIREVDKLFGYQAKIANEDQTVLAS